MKGVLTSYTINGKVYASYILGEDIEKIKMAAKSRNLGESIDSVVTEIAPMPKFSILNDRDLLKNIGTVLHTTTFLTFIALKSGVISLEDTVGDEGVLHELTHLVANVDGCHKKSLICIRDLIASLEDSVIGIYEPV